MISASQRAHNPASLDNYVAISDLPCGDADSKMHGSRRIYQLPPPPVVVPQNLTDLLLNPFNNTLLDTRQVKPVPFIIAAPMRVAGNLQHLNCLKVTLAQDDVRDKTTDDFLSYSEQVENANRQQQMPDVLKFLQKDPLYEVYQELNVGVDRSSSIGFIRDLLGGQSAGKTYERPLLKTIIELCKAHPGTSLNNVMIMLAARPTGSHSKDVQTLMTFYNDWADDSADVDANPETGQAGEAQRAAGAGSGSKWGTVTALVIGGLVFLGRAATATASPAPWSSRTVFAVATTSFLYMSSSPVWGELLVQPQSQSILEGGKLVLEAGFSGAHCRVGWTKDNIDVHNTDRITITQVSDNNTCRSELKISPVIRSDTDLYQALLKNVKLAWYTESSGFASIAVLPAVPKKEYPICTIWPQEYRTMDLVNLICISENIPREQPSLSFYEGIGMGMEWRLLHDGVTDSNDTNVWISKVLMAGRADRNFACQQSHVDAGVNSCQVLLRANDSVTLTAQPVTLTAQPVTLTAQPVTLIAQEGEGITPQINCNNTFLEAQLRMERIKIGVYSATGIVSSLFLGSVLYWIYKQYERNRHQNPAPAPVEL